MHPVFGSVDRLLKWVISFLSVSQESQQLDVTPLELGSSEMSLSQALKSWNSSLLFRELSNWCSHWNGVFMLLYIQEFKIVPSTKLREYIVHLDGVFCLRKSGNFPSAPLTGSACCAAMGKRYLHI